MGLSAPASPVTGLLFMVVVFVSPIILPTVGAQGSTVLDSGEAESVYRVLEALNSGIPWRTMFPDDLCVSGPHGLACDRFSGGSDNETLHVTELSFGYISEYAPNPPCTPESVFSELLFTFRHLRKLFFYRCFSGKSRISVPFIPATFGSSLEELVFIENPSLGGPFAGVMGRYPRLRRLILTGTGVSGSITDGVGGCAELEEITLSRNLMGGKIPPSLGRLKKLRIFDLSGNRFNGKIPRSIGGLSRLSKLDLSHNRLSGELSERLKVLQRMEFLDLSYNRFVNSGIPLFLREMPKLRELHLSGNNLGGKIPEIWENLGGVLSLGLSGAGLVGNIPPSMGLFLRNLCYLGLDNNHLDAEVPQELALMGSVKEMNLENNKLSGRLPFPSEFTARIGGKLKLSGNPDLCMDEGLMSAKNNRSLGCLKLCKKPQLPGAVLPYSGASSPDHLLPQQLMIIICLFFNIL